MLGRPTGDAIRLPYFLVFAPLEVSFTTVWLRNYFERFVQTDSNMVMMSKTIPQRSVVTIVSLIIAIFVGCYSQGTGEEQELSQGVVGTVWLKPGFDGEDAQYYLDPPDQTPHPLVGAMVCLMRYSSDNLNSRDIITTTRSDSLGRFELRARPGTYHLAVSTTVGATVGA